MNNIVFIGNSLAAVKAIEDIRQVNSSVGITLITDGYYPYDRERLFSYLAKEIKEKQTLVRPESFYKEHKVRVITDQTITRFNFKRNQIFFENKEQLEYDILVLADIAAPRWPDIKGTHKQGVAHVVRLKDVKAVAEQLPFIETVTVQLTSMTGFRTLCALSNAVKEVVVSTPSNEILKGWLDADSSSMLKQLLEQSGVRLMLDNPIEEILGDTEAKAVRFKSGKVFAADIIILDDLRLDTRIIKESGLELIGSYQTNFKNVYLVDAFLHAFKNSQTSDFNTLSSALLEQGSAVVREILGQPSAQSNTLNVTRFELKGLRGFCAGQTRLREGGREFLRFDASRNIYKKIFAEGDCLSGAIFFNADDAECSQILDLLAKGVSIQGQEERLLEGSLDLAELSKS
jgi:nitrite reductase (NADH) large subunit